MTTLISELLSLNSKKSSPKTICIFGGSDLHIFLLKAMLDCVLGSFLQMDEFLPEDNIFDVLVSPSDNRWTRWDANAGHSWISDYVEYLPSILHVPSPYQFGVANLMNFLMNAGLKPLVVGPRGVGKSTLLAMLSSSREFRR